VERDKKSLLSCVEVVVLACWGGELKWFNGDGLPASHRPYQLENARRIWNFIWRILMPADNGKPLAFPMKKKKVTKKPVKPWIDDERRSVLGGGRKSSRAEEYISRYDVTVYY
jgi:hypothetical protein